MNNCSEVRKGPLSAKNNYRSYNYVHTSGFISGVLRRRPLDAPGCRAKELVFINNQIAILIDLGPIDNICAAVKFIISYCFGVSKFNKHGGGSGREE